MSPIEIWELDHVEESVGIRRIFPQKENQQDQKEVTLTELFYLVKTAEWKGTIHFSLTDEKKIEKIEVVNKNNNCIIIVNQEEELPTLDNLVKLLSQIGDPGGMCILKSTRVNF